MVVAGAILQVGVDGVVGFGETHLLHKRGAILKIAQVHVEELVVVADFVAPGFQFAHQFHAVEFVHVERGLHGAVVAQVGGVDMPTLLNLSREDNLGFGRAVHLQMRTEFYGIDHLRLRQQCYQCQQSE